MPQNEQGESKRRHLTHAPCPNCQKETWPALQCPSCLLNGCVDCATHLQLGTDALGQPCCAANGALCGACGKPYRLDPSPCANCRRCSACSGALNIDLCATCLTPVDNVIIEHLTVSHQLVPGQGAQGRRQLNVLGVIREVTVGKRGSTPPSLSSVEIDGDIKEMKQYDRGHIIALELHGIDDSLAIAPMNYQFNRSGKWRVMEGTIRGLMKGEAAVDVYNKPLVSKPVIASTNTLSQRAGSTINTDWTMTVWLFYDDALGDARVPVWFYVRVRKGDTLIAHFSLANRCDKAETMPYADEIAEFAAAQTIFQSLTSDDLQAVLIGAHVPADDKWYAQLKSGDLTAPALKEVGPEKHKIIQEVHAEHSRYIIGNALPDKPPYQLLQFMWVANCTAEKQRCKEVFKTMQLTTQGKSRSYDGFQREYLRAFNRWKNAGKLISDASVPDLYDGERTDIWTNLNEGGGREAPEVDHVVPNYQGGANSYINARLVSFQHNHMYREKKTTGAQPVSEKLISMFRLSQVAFFNGSSSKYGKDNKSWTISTGTTPGSINVRIPTNKELASLDANNELTALFTDDALFKDTTKYALLESWHNNREIKELVHDRRAFLLALDATYRRQQAEETLADKYQLSAGRHAAALESFINSAVLTHQGRNSLKKLIDEADMSLCLPSDLLGDDGGLLNPTQPEIFPQVPNPEDEQVYKDAIKAMGQLKQALGI